LEIHYQAFDSRNTLPTNAQKESESLEQLARISHLASRISYLASRFSLHASRISFLNQLALPDVTVVAE
jgi:hypothetical protein